MQLRSGRMRPELIVDLKRIPDLIGIREDGDSFVIGAATPGVMLSEHEAFSRAWPGIVEGVDLIGSQQIQGRASLVGNLCNASPAADSVPAMIARACGRRHRRPRWQARGAGRGDRHRARPDLAEEGRVHRRVSRAEAQAAAIGRLSALHPAHRDGYCRRRLRRQCDPRRERPLHRCARRARRGGADPAHRRRGRRGAEGPPARRRHAFPARRRRAASLQTDQRQARHDRIPNQGRRRPRKTGGRHRI